MEQYARTDSQTASLSADSLRQSRYKWKTGFGDEFAVSLHFEYTERHRRFVDVGELIAEVSLMNCGRYAQGLGDKVAVGQYRRQPVGMSLQYQGNLSKNQLQRHMIADQMVETQSEQPFILGRIVGDVGGE